ncbi:MAG: galactose mutarotase [Bacteroidales bacterium]|nr:galactose mutarotase [Bacteroidales bacterium]
MIEKTLWGKTPCGKEIWKYKMTNASGASAEVSSVGAGIVAITVPDKDGKLADVVLGYPKPESYFGDGPCFGKCPGRYANRIAKGHFTLDGKEYDLPINNGPNHLHGGPQGFQNQVWDSRIDGNSVEFQYIAEDGEMGYPGTVKAVARYDWSESNELQLTFTAQSDAPTIINLTNHVYFNLNGDGAGDIFGHVLKLNASEWLPTDESLIPLGDSEPVAGTPMDFTSEKTLGQDIRTDFPALKYGKGYDNCWVIDGGEPGQLQWAAQLYSPESGRSLEVLTTQPGIQVYTGNWLEGCPEGKCGRSYHDYEGVALECQNYPDAPNKADYPSPVLRPGDTYEQAIIFAFGVK